MKLSQQYYTVLCWSLVALAFLLPIFAWGSYYDWDIPALSGYQWFPLFGFIAWQLMWVHYVTGALRILHPTLKKPSGYHSVTWYVVLGALLLHPGILIIKQWQNNGSLPPASYLTYVGQGVRYAVVAGSIALTLFLLYDVLFRLSQSPPIAQRWHWISLSQAVAMWLIYMHGLVLGTIINDGWYKFVWVLYGAALIPSTFVIVRYDLSHRIQKKMS
jgi:hypothetical protein